MSKSNPFKGFHSSPEIIRLAVMMYIRFPLSLRNVEDLLHERGIDISHETVRFWWNRFGPMFAAEIRRRRVDRMRAFSNWRWHVDEVFVKVNGERHYLWRAVDDEGEILDVLVQRKRDRKAALKLLRKLLKRQGYVPDSIVTDRLRSYSAALRDLALADRHVTGGRSNNRAEVSHQPTRRRERQQLRFKSPGSAQRFLTPHAAMANHFNVQRHLISRRTLKILRAEVLAGWREIVAP